VETEFPHHRVNSLGASGGSAAGAAAALGGFAGGHGESANGNDREKDDVFHSVVMFWLVSIPNETEKNTQTLGAAAPIGCNRDQRP
jgi:hypothetical protein